MNFQNSRRYAELLLVGCLCLSGAGVSRASDECNAKLGVTLASPIHYRAANGDRFVARYGHLSDQSLYFVKLSFPSGKEYTLPNTLSASGVRYSDEMQVSWWEHHGEIRLEIRDDQGKWVQKFGALREEKVTP